MPTKFQIKRSAVSGVVPTTGDISSGELAINLADKKIFTANTTAVFELGSNLTNLSVTGNTTIVGLIANGSLGTDGHVLHSNGTVAYWAPDDQGVTSVSTGNGLTGGPITTTGTISVLANNGISVTGDGVFAVGGNGLFVTSAGLNVGSGNGVITDPDSIQVLGGSSLTVNTTGVHVNTSNLSIQTSQLTGDIALGTQTSGNYVATITAGDGVIGSATGEGSTPTIAVLSNTGIVSNSTGVFVNATHIATLSANDSSFLGGVAAASYVNTSGNYTITGIHTYNANLIMGTGGIIANGSSGTDGHVLHTNGTTVYWAPDESGGAGVNTAAEYVWTNTHIFNSNLTTNATLIVAKGLQANGSTGGASEYLHSNGSGGVYWATPVGSTEGLQTIWVPAISMYSRTTNGAEAGIVESTTNRVMIRSYDFDPNTQEFVQFTIRLPKQWDEGTIQFQPYWTAVTANVGNVEFSMAAVSLSNNDAIDTAFGTSQASRINFVSNSTIHVGPLSANITIAGTPVAGDITMFQVARDVADDTLIADADLIGVAIFITTDAGNDN